MTDFTFAETVGEQPLKVDRDRGVIFDVKILGFTSRNRRRYDPAAVEDAKSFYEGIYVNVDHDSAVLSTPDSPGGRPVNFANKPRGVKERFAKLTGVYSNADGLFAKEMRCNTAHPFTPTLLWWAENDPAAVALSHIASGPVPSIGPDGIATVKRITKVSSVDVVGTGGSNVSLFESFSEMNPNETLGQSVRVLFAEGLTDDAIVKQITNAIKPPAPFTGDAAAALEALKSTPDPRVRVLVEALDARFASDAETARRNLAIAACKEAKLTEKQVTSVFVESLVLADDARWPALIEDRKSAFVESITPNPPKSGPANVTPTLDQFLRHVRSAR